MAGTTYLTARLNGAGTRYELPGEHPLTGRGAPDLELADGSRLADHLHGGRALLLDLTGDPELKGPRRARDADPRSRDINTGISIGRRRGAALQGVTHMVEIKTDQALELMREAGRVVANALAAAREAAAVGVSLRELDAAAHAVITKAGASSPFLGYQPSFASLPFPAVLCTSVNDAVAHGIPSDYRLRDGDLVSVDCGAELDGWTGDAAISFTVGTPRPADLELIAATEQALDAGIAAATVGHRIGDISHAVSAVARKAACGMPSDFGGHGIGRQMHEDPHVPNHGRPRRGFPLRHGLTLAIEPMLMSGGDNDYYTDRDGWTLRTCDGSRAAHFEHTVAITHDGPRILTLP